MKRKLKPQDFSCALKIIKLILKPHTKFDHGEKAGVELTMMGGQKGQKTWHR